MHRYLRWTLIAVGLAIPLGVAGFFIGMRHQPLTPAQQLALQRLSAPTPPVQGADASDLVWLLDLDVPEDRRAEVAAKVREFERQRGPGGATRRDPRLDWPAFPALPKDGKGLCAMAVPGCIAYVAENRKLVAATLEANAGALASQARIADFDGYRRGFPVNVYESVPNLGQFRRLRTTDIALRFTSSLPLPAVDEVCRDLAGWRRVGGDSDDVLVSMIGVAWVREDLMLLADMLAKLPKEMPLPDQCAAALATSDASEFDLCPAARSTFGFYRRMREFNAAGKQGRRVPEWWVDWPRLNARIAADIGRLCDPSLTAQLQTDAPASSLLPLAPSCSKWERRADPVGCELYESVRSELHVHYLDRRGDQAQMLALMRTVDWLRLQVDSKEAVPQALAHLPPELGLLRTPEYDLEHDRISIPLHDVSRAPRFELAAGADARPVSRRKPRCCSRRPSRNLAALD